MVAEPVVPLHGRGDLVDMDLAADGGETSAAVANLEPPGPEEEGARVAGTSGQPFRLL